MVDSIGPKAPAPRDRRVAPVSGVAATSAVASVADKPSAATGASASPVATLATEMATTPPVDAEHVARIRKAIADGTFPISPATIADRFLALRMDWTSHDKA